MSAPFVLGKWRSAKHQLEVAVEIGWSLKSPKRKRVVVTGYANQCEELVATEAGARWLAKARAVMRVEK